MTDELIERYPHELRISFLGDRPVKAIIEGVEFVPASELQSQSARIAELEGEKAKLTALARSRLKVVNAVKDENERLRLSLTKDSTSG